VPDDIWEAAKERAAERGETISQVVVDSLRRYAKKK